FQTTNPAIQKGHPSLGMDAHGNIAVTWEGWDEDGDGSSGGVFVRAFDNSGRPRSDRVPVNTYTTSLRACPSSGMADSRDVVIAWTRTAPEDGSGYGIFGQRFKGAGTPVGAEFQINTYTTFNQEFPSVAINPSGRLAVAWMNLIEIDEPG